MSKKKKVKGVRCQLHGEVIRVPCKLDSCLLHTEYPNVRNCILCYMAKHEVKELKPIDIGMLRNIPEKSVTKSLNKAMTKMRSNTIGVSHFQGEIEKKFVTLLDRNVCYNCECPITTRMKKGSSHVKLPRTSSKVWYCSPECQEAKPPQWVAAERDCNNTIEIVMQWAVAKYSTLGGLEQSLGMSRKLLGYSLKKLLEVSADELYPTTKRVKTRSKSLVRRTGSKPEWLMSYNSSLSPILEKMEAKYGAHTKNLDELTSKAAHYIESI